MGGRAAEQLVLGEGSTGASNDLAGATQLATRMVTEFGMSPKLGPVGFVNDGPAYLGQQEIRSRQHAEATQRVIDEEVERLLKEANERATTLLSDHREALDRVMALLLERETIDGSDVMAAAGQPPEPTAAPEAPDRALAHRADRRSLS
jgi:cell division protease FtsH